MEPVRRIITGKVGSDPIALLMFDKGIFADTYVRIYMSHAFIWSSELRGSMLWGPLLVQTLHLMPCGARHASLMAVWEL